MENTRDSRRAGIVKQQHEPMHETGSTLEHELASMHVEQLGRRGGIAPKTPTPKADPAAMTAADLFVFDCFDKAVMTLEDTFTNATFKIIHTQVVFLAADEVKGKCNAIFNSFTQQCELEYDFKLKLKFAIGFEGNVYRGWIVLVHMTKAKLAEQDFDMSIYWNNNISPKGIIFNQTTSVLISPRSRERIRTGFRDFEKSTCDLLLAKLLRFTALDTLGVAFFAEMNRQEEVNRHRGVSKVAILDHHKDDDDTTASSFERKKKRNKVIDSIALDALGLNTASDRRTQREKGKSQFKVSVVEQAEGSDVGSRSRDPTPGGTPLGTHTHTPVATPSATPVIANRKSSTRT